MPPPYGELQHRGRPPLFLPHVLHSAWRGRIQPQQQSLTLRKVRLELDDAPLLLLVQLPRGLACCSDCLLAMGAFVVQSTLEGIYLRMVRRRLL